MYTILESAFSKCFIKSFAFSGLRNQYKFVANGYLQPLDMSERMNY